ncbi:hypothetical protein [Lysobacter sp. Hz 25]|uniref:hypothetical protein n=1 Tax=Lysobacter sp. Hz 25 TaxID=3383698 RepID=UPI0038D3B119
MTQALHFAALSFVDFSRTISTLEARLGLEVLERDDEVAWAYVTATLPDGTQINLTKTDKTTEIVTWLPGAPGNVNWQIIFSGDELSGSGVSAALLVMEDALGVRPEQYHPG